MLMAGIKQVSFQSNTTDYKTDYGQYLLASYLLLPTGVLHSCAYSQLFTPWCISGSRIYFLHCLSLYKHISGCYGAPLYERRGSLWGGVGIVYYCARCARVPWKRSSNNESNLQWWRTLSRLMFWNKCFKATMWTICGVYLWIYG